MIKLSNNGCFFVNGAICDRSDVSAEMARKNTIAYSILSSHNASNDNKKLKIRFDSLISHDITYVGIIQTARASGLVEFPIPYAMTNCHNSLCAVGGTINEDDHVFGLSAARKYGGIYVPANQSVIHSFAREEMTSCGKMILGSDSHTRYGALGTLAVGEGGPELVKQLLKRTYDISYPEVVLVYLKGSPKKGVGPHDVALALVGEVFKSGFVKNRILEFTGPGLASLSMDFRNGIDVMTTETACLSSIWETDGVTEEYYIGQGRPNDYKKLAPKGVAYYDRLIELDLSEVESMIALPFHPSNAYTVHEFVKNAKEILASVDSEAKKNFPKCDMRLTDKIMKDGSVMADQGIIAGCAGGMYDNICEAAAILETGCQGNGRFSLSVYPTSIPTSLHLTRTGVTERLLMSGAVIKPSFCGPCFGAGDVPSNNGFSLRHTTRNFPNREGSKPGEGQLSGVALMDSRSIAATAANGGRVTAATDVEYDNTHEKYVYDRSVYEKRVYFGFGKADKEQELIIGPNITDWQKMDELSDNVLLSLSAVIRDKVTTTDELIPSGETSSYRSNPQRLAEFTLSRRVPEYVGRSKRVRALEEQRKSGDDVFEISELLSFVGDANELIKNTQYGSCVYAERPGDGSAREQAASCQRVLGGLGNICIEFATKRYRSNCINWGILPFTVDESDTDCFEDGDSVFVPNVRMKLINGDERFEAFVINKNGIKKNVTLSIVGLTDDERDIILDGCLMNYYKNRSEKNEI